MTQSTRREISARTADLLHAYHDGELSGFARWRLEWRLRRSPELRRELAELARIGAWVREAEPQESEPDLWESIALRLPAIDARRAEGEEHSPGLGWLAWPGAFASAAIAAVVAFVWMSQPTPKPIGVVRWIDSGPRDVMVLKSSSDTTIVWVIGPPARRAPRGENGDV